MMKSDSSPLRLPGQRLPTTDPSLAPEIVCVIERTQGLIEETIRIDSERIGFERIDPDRIASELGDTVVRHLFDLGLRMQSLQSRADDGLQDQISKLVAEVDDIIREIRGLVLGLKTDRP